MNLITYLFTRCDVSFVLFILTRHNHYRYMDPKTNPDPNSKTLRALQAGYESSVQNFSSRTEIRAMSWLTKSLDLNIMEN